MLKKNQNESLSHPSQFSHQHSDDVFEFNLFDFIHFAYSRRYFIVIFSGIFLAAMLIWGFVIQRPVYKSQTTVNVNLSSKTQTFTMARFTNWLEEQEMQNKVYLTEQFFNSTSYKRAVYDEVIGKTERCTFSNCNAIKKSIRDYLFKKIPGDDSEGTNELFDHLEIYSDSTKYILTIVGSSPNPDISLALTHVAVDLLLELNYEHLIKKNSRVKNFLEIQTEKTRIELDELEKSFAEQQTKNGFIATPETENRLTGVFIETKNKLMDAQREKMAMDLLIKEIEADLADFRKDLASDNKPSHLYFTQAQRRFDLLKYQIEIDKLSRSPSSSSTASSLADTTELDGYKKILIEDKDQLIAIDPWAYIKKAEELLIESRQKALALNSQIESFESTLKETTGQYMKMPETFRLLTNVKRNIQITTELYSQLKSRLQETNIQEAERANDLAILSLPEKPHSPAGISTNRKLIVSLATGPIVAILFLLINYVVIPVVRGEKDLQKLGLRVIGRYTQYRRKNQLLGKRFYPIILKEALESYEANAIRFTRMKLEQALSIHQGQTQNSKIISMSSINSGEGKTFSAVNLAYSFSLAKYKVALLDLDVRRSDMPKYFDLKGTSAHVIQSEDSHVRIDVYEVEPDLFYLAMQFQGVDYRDYMESDSFRSFIDGLRKPFDLVFVDTPPLDGHVESFLISSAADATLFMVNQRIALKDDVVRGLESLQESASGPILSILNFSNEGLGFLNRNKKEVA